MAYIDDLKLLLKFNSTAIFEEISQTNMSVFGDNYSPEVPNGVYQMQDDQYLFGDGIANNGYLMEI